MGLLLFRAFLAINAFNIATENPVTPNPYRFPVYPVNECPKSENEFKTAAQRRNCTRGSRYLCAPNKYISSLIEFCTDRSRGLYKEGNCVLLEGTGDLDSYSCEEKFNSSCPLEPYFDEDIFKYPACLEIDRELQCFVADNNCSKRELPTIETPLNISTMETVGNETFRRSSPRLLAIVYIIAVVSAGMILILVIFQKRRKEQGERYKKKDENKSLLTDPELTIKLNDDVQLDQTAINVFKNIPIQTTSTETVSETVKKDTQTSKTIQREEKRKEESGYKTATSDGKQQHNPEIDDDKLRQFLSKGNISVCHVRCIIVGCGKAGKTTLLKRLQNVSFDELIEIERTEMVDFHVNSFEVLLEEETIQSVNEEDTLPTILFSKEKLEMGLKDNAGKMTEEADQPGVNEEDTLPTILFSKEKLEMGLKANAGQMTEEADQPGVGGKNQLVENSSQKNTENIPRDVPKNPTNNNNAENEGGSIPEPQDKIFVQNQLSPNTNETHVEDDKINFEKYAILKIKDAVNELLNENDLRPRITFLDFAGQSMYYAFHQIFLRPKSCSILVVDMTKSLNDEVDVQDGNEKECSQFALWRYRDYYKFWLKSIDSFSDTESPVIIVGTHADKLSKEECRKFLKSLNELFDNWFHSDLRRHLNEDRMYTIGFPDSGSELEDLKNLKKCIANIVKCPRYSKENIRPVWALFEHILNKMKETEKVISRKTLSDYSDQLSAQEFRIDESEISKMLVFFHRVGVLLYFDKDGLKEKIILDIQWLLDAFKCIIDYPVRPEENDMKRRHFCRTGELDNVELDRIWHIQGKDFLKHKTTIMAYMQQLGLVMPLKELHSIDSTVYYFPSMNSKRFDKTGENYSKSSIICFKFDDEMQLPINVFHIIVLKCSKLDNWSILTEEEKYNICLYQNAACFSFQKHVVVLRNCNFEIRVQVWASPTIYDGRLLKKIKHSVEDIIRDDELSYKIGYKCRKDVLNDEEDKSFISQSTFPVSNHLCETCDVDKKHVVDNDICWELEVNENKVDELTTFASSPEFASMPAKISPEARNAQEPIVSAGKAMIDGACHMVTAAKQLAVNPKDPPTYQLYSNHSKSVSEASIKDCAPGQRECDESIDKLNRSIRDLDQASLAAISQSLQQRTEKSLRGFQEQMIGSAREIHDLCSKVKDSAKAEPENLGHRVTMMASYFGPLSDGAVGAASLIQNSKQQTHILDLTKTVAESALQFMYSCKEGGGNPKAPKHTHDNIDTAADNTMDVVQDLLQSLEEAASQAGVVNSMIEKLTKSITKTDEQVMVREGMSFVEYQSNMVSLAKKIAMTTQEMVGKAGVNPGDLGRLANQLTRDYDVLASNSANAAATSNSQDIANRIRTTVQDLGKSCVELVQDAGKVQGDPHDTYARRDLQDHARSVSEKVAFVLAALQSGSRGTQACINAASAVSGIIADLDTTIMFATAGTLCTEGDDSFASHREDILKTAKALVEETKKLVQGAASDQETLAGAAQQAVKTITKLADVVKLGAASLGSNQPEAQVMIINAVKDVASALSDLISATKNASGKNVSDPAMMTLKESAKVMVTNVTSLLKTVKTVEDEAARGTRALESTIEAIGQEVKSYEAGTLPEKKATAEDLIRLTKPITTATAKAVAAGNSGRQEDVIICANMGRKAIFDLLATCRGTASTAETTEVRQKTIAAGKNCAVVYKDLLEQVSTVVQKPSQEAKQTLAARAHQVAVSVQEIVHCSELIKGTDWVDPEDPTVIAESELLTAAKSIEAAAQKLSQLKPRKKAKEADMSLNFEEQILEAAKSIASATAALVKSASAAQRELVAQGKVRTRKEIGATYHKSQILDDDGQWSEGLISAAKMVAAATHSLCESANAMVQGHATEERLIASAKEVAGSTAHLLVACRVKADPDSVAMKRLQAAGNAVKRATEVLVKAAQQAKQRDEDEDINVAVDSRKVGGIKQELQIQEEMLRKEREWIEAREKLAKFRKQRYKDTGHDSDSSSAF